MQAADEFVRKNQHGDALVRRMGRGVRKAVGASGQIRSQAEISEYLRRPVSGFRQITVVSVRGGAGKTTVAALIATELARHRPDRVLAMDADAELGSLPLRLGVRSELSLFELAAQQPRTFEEAARYMQQTREGLWVLAATRGGRITGEFDFDTFQSAFSAVSRYISTAVTDCSAGILTDLHRGILGQSHSVVLVTPGTVDGALSARGALEWFSQGGQQRLLPRTVIAMVSHAPQIGADLNRATQMLTAWGRPSCTSPMTGISPPVARSTCRCSVRAPRRPSAGSPARRSPARSATRARATEPRRRRRGPVRWTRRSARFQMRVWATSASSS